MNLGPSGPSPSSQEKSQIRSAIEAGHVIYKTSAEWAGVVLADKAIGVETNVSPRKMKIGDGATAWGSLSYVGSAEISDIEGLQEALDDKPDTASELLDILKGQAGNVDKFGAEYLPDALSGNGPPIETPYIRVTGSLTSNGSSPILFPVLVLAGERYGKPRYTADGTEADEQPSIYWNGVRWVLYYEFEVNWQSGTEDTETPDLATGWEPLGDCTGIPVLTLNETVASFVGQLYQDADTGIWYKWSGLAWVEEAPVTTVDVLSALQGVNPDEDKIGSEYLPNALSGEGSPVAPKISVLGTQSYDDDYFQYSQNEGRPAYYNVTRSIWIRWQTDRWQIVSLSAPFTGDVYTLDDVARPDLATTWVRTGTEDTGGPYYEPLAVFTAGVPADYVGQSYHDTLNDLWYKWGGTAWAEEAAVTAASIAAAQASEKSSPADTDSIAIVSPAGNRMSLATLWGMLTAKLGALTGNITAAGAWSFTSRPQSSAAANSANVNELVTRAEADSRYFREKTARPIAGEAGNTNSSTFKDSTGLTLYLEVGTWEFESLEHIDAGASFATAGAKTKLAFTGTGTFYGGYRYYASSSNAESLSYPTGRNSAGGNVWWETGNATGSISAMRIGTIVVTVPGNLVVQFANYAAVAGSTPTLGLPSHLKARKVS